MADGKAARRWVVRGRVQGVGFRYFTQRAAAALGLCGYVRNLDDGSVEVYAIGTEGQLSELAGTLRQGPRWADVRAVEESGAEIRSFHSFAIEP